MKAIIYCRKSTESEERQVQSLEAQENWCDEYAKSHNFFVVEKILESKSAKQPWRPWFNKMMQLIADKKADYIICWSLNRLSRNPIDEGTIKWLTQSWTIKEIHSTDGISNGQNILLMSMHFGMATQFIIDLKKNVMRWMMQKLEKGWALHQAPSWYKNDKNINEFIIDEEESKYVKKLFELRAKKIPYKQISEILYKEGWKSRTWKPKAPSTLEQIVKNKFYIWIIQFAGKMSEWIHPTFISKKLFDEANWFRKSTKITQKSTHSEFIFQKMIKYQWKLMRAYKTKNNVYYREAMWVKSSFNISQKLLLELIEKELPKYTLPEELKEDFSKWLIKYFEEMNKWNKSEIIETRKKLDLLKEENKNLVRKSLSWKISDEILEEIQEENLLRIKDLEEKLKDLSSVDMLIDQEIVELFKMFTNSQKLWQKLDLTHKGLLIKTMIVELNFDNKKQLNIENTKLFTLIREINFLKWQSH